MKLVVSKCRAPAKQGEDIVYSIWKHIGQVGFKSMLDTFINRQHFAYNINSLDNLLVTKYIPESFLMYDEQILKILKAAGIPGPDAYAATKAIKKKKADKVASYKERFKVGFTKYLKETEGATEEKAHEVVEQVWRIIEDAANYMFCCSHAFSMACDSLYVAWLKAHYPYELYKTMLKLYDEKKNKEKIASIIAEMKRYKGIQITTGRFGQDNRDWYVDKQNGIVSQSLSSIRYMQKQAAEELYQLGLLEEAEMGVEMKPDVFTKEAKARINKINKELKPLQLEAEAYLRLGGDEFDEEFLALYDEGMPLEEELKAIKADPASYESRACEVHHMAKLDCFTNVLRAIQMNTHLDTRQIELLIGLNYFEQFGKTGKLMKVFDYFFNGEKKLSKTIKSFEERLEMCRQYEASLDDSELSTGCRLRTEMDNIGLCITVDPNAPSSAYFVQEIDDKYTIKVKLYSMKRGTTGIVKIAKKDYKTMGVGSCIIVEKYRTGPKYSFRNGQKAIVPGEKEIWLTNYRVMQKDEAGVA